jgi:acyl-CoA synthetase (AMP-forming)/AMP-acid ligase II
MSGDWAVWHVALAVILIRGALWAFVRPVNTFFALASVLGLLLLFAGCFHPDATAEAVHADGFRTGDIGRVDEDGYYYTVGRKKDLIIHGGYNAYPREMEEVLYEHPAGRSGLFWTRVVA